jgi:hypothetical protein
LRHDVFPDGLHRGERLTNMGYYRTSKPISV